MRFSVVVPTLNAGKLWPVWQAALAEQSLAPDKIIVCDSQSNDGTADAAAACGYDVVPVERARFDHGGTRQQAVSYAPADSEILIYLTQDAILAEPDSFRHIIAAFENPAVGIAYGRQLPRKAARPLEAHARIFNYPAVSETRDFGDRNRLGLKAAFCSNSFAAYRRTALDAVGGFPRRTIFSEDMIVAARMLKAGWKVAYVADAQVYHSHDYTIAEEFRRYVDIGTFHARESWLLDDFGKPEGEGLRFIQSEFAYLLQRAPQMIPVAGVKTIAKYAGYRIGKLERFLPPSFKMKLSMNKGFWRNQPTN